MITAKDLALVANDIRVEALHRAFAGTEFSPVDLHRDLHARGVGPSLGSIAYHVRVLLAAGLLQQSRTQERRGATEHYYLVNDARRGDVAKLLAAVCCLDEA